MRKSEVLLTLGFLGSAAISAWLWGELRAERMLFAELSLQVNSRPPPVAAPEPALAPAPVPALATVAATPDSFAATSAARLEPSEKEVAQASQRQLLQQAHYREAWRAQQRLNYALRRENVIRLLGLTPQEADAIVEIAIDRHLTWLDRPRPKVMTEEFAQQQRALSQQDKREDDARLLALLGEEKRARFQEYMASRSTRVHVDQLRPKFTGADALRDDQVEPLIAALHVERTRLHAEQQEYRAQAHSDPSPNMQQYGERELELLKSAYERMHKAAAPVLSSSQLIRLDTLLKRDFERQVLEAGTLSGAPNSSVYLTD